MSMSSSSRHLPNVIEKRSLPTAGSDNEKGERKAENYIESYNDFMERKLVEVDAQKRASVLYRRVRNRFFGKLRRDILRNATIEDMATIEEIRAIEDMVAREEMVGVSTGNHRGDMAFDMTMYQGPHARQDPETFRFLYGLDPSQASTIRMLPGSINIYILQSNEVHREPQLS